MGTIVSPNKILLKSGFTMEWRGIGHKCGKGNGTNINDMQFGLVQCAKVFDGPESVNWKQAFGELMCSSQFAAWSS